MFQRLVVRVTNGADTINAREIGLDGLPRQELQIVLFNFIKHAGATQMITSFVLKRFASFSGEHSRLDALFN